LNESLSASASFNSFSYSTGITTATSNTIKKLQIALSNHKHVYKSNELTIHCIPALHHSNMQNQQLIHNTGCVDKNNVPGKNSSRVVSDFLDKHLQEKTEATPPVRIIIIFGSIQKLQLPQPTRALF